MNMRMEVSMKVGFVGLGTMGAHMASNLQARGYELVVNDIRREAAAPHLGAGATWADTPCRLAEAVEVVFTSLPGPLEVEAVALGDDGLLAGLSAGKTYFDLSTNSPALVRRMHAVFAARGVHMLDAPVSGGPRGARTRKLALWSAATRRSSGATRPCWTRSATGRSTWARSARAPSPSSSTTARVTRSSARWRRSSRSA
jgi:3-hydroxyisobutyrate dehydrogenase